MSFLASSLALAAADDGWRDRALCRDTDPDLFFPVGTTGHALVQIEHAKAVCGQCPVTGECLDFALDTNQDMGPESPQTRWLEKQLKATDARKPDWKRWLAFANQEVPWATSTDQLATTRPIEFEVN